MEPLKFDNENLISGNLMRVTLINNSGHEKILVCAFHHIITDFMSIEIIANELDIAYENPNPEESPQVNRPAIQYHDHVLSMSEWLLTDSGIAAEKYWGTKT